MLSKIILLVFVANVFSELRLQHFQTTGTHNSYHVPSNPTTIHWNYTFPSISNQLSTENVRVLEFDIIPNATSGEIDVFHIPIYDANSNCRTLTECIRNIRDWSLANPSHGPIFIQIEPKNISLMNQEVWNQYDTILNSAFAPGQILTPDVVRGNSSTLLEQISTIGWPTFNESRGKVVFYIIRGYGAYGTGIHSELVNRTSFIAYDIKDSNRSDASIFVLDDPITYGPNITELVRRNFIVRTRADAEYFPGAERLTPIEISEQYFNVVDLDNSNTLSVSEIYEFCNALGIPITSSILSSLQSVSGSTEFNISQWNRALSLLAQAGQQIIEGVPTFEQTSNRRDAAYASGAQLVATDYPVPPYSGASQSREYWAQTPGGNVYRCNPITSQGLVCSDSDFESNPNLTSTSGVSETNISYSSQEYLSTGMIFNSLTTSYVANEEFKRFFSCIFVEPNLLIKQIHFPTCVAEIPRNIKNLSLDTVLLRKQEEELPPNLQSLSVSAIQNYAKLPLSLTSLTTSPFQNNNRFQLDSTLTNLKSLKLDAYELFDCTFPKNIESIEFKVTKFQGDFFRKVFLNTTHLTIHRCLPIGLKKLSIQNAQIQSYQLEGLPNTLTELRINYGIFRMCRNLPSSLKILDICHSKTEMNLNWLPASLTELRDSSGGYSMQEKHFGLKHLKTKKLEQNFSSLFPNLETLEVEKLSRLSVWRFVPKTMKRITVEIVEYIDQNDVEAFGKRTETKELLKPKSNWITGTMRFACSWN